MEMFYGSKDMIRCLNVVYNEAEYKEITAYEYQIKMIEVNQIPFLLDACVMDVNHKSELRFLTGNCHVFSKHFRYRKINGEIFRIVIEQIFKCADALALYLLPTENLVLNPDYMFFDEGNQCTQFVYIPGYNKNLKQQLKLLLEYMMQVFDSSDRDGIQQLYQMYNDIGEDTWGSNPLERIKQYPDSCNVGGNIDSCNVGENIDSCYVRDNINTIIDSGETDIQLLKEVPEQIGGRNAFWLVVIGMLVSVVIFSLSFFVFGNKNVFWLYIASAGCVLLAIFCAYVFSEKKENEDEAMEEYLRDRGEKTYEAVRYCPEEDIIAGRSVFTEEHISTDEHISAEEQVHALVPLTNGSLGEIVFREYGDKIVVGRSRNEADYRLATTAISRVHAYIFQREGGVFLEDRESQNGTFLNSVRIPSNEIKKLNRGDIVGFANEEFFVS